MIVRTILIATLLGVSAVVLQPALSGLAVTGQLPPVPSAGASPTASAGGPAGAVTEAAGAVPSASAGERPPATARMPGKHGSCTISAAELSDALRGRSADCNRQFQAEATTRDEERPQASRAEERPRASRDEERPRASRDDAHRHTPRVVYDYTRWYNRPWSDTNPSASHPFYYGQHPAE